MGSGTSAAADGQPYQTGRSMYLATVLMEIGDEDGLCGLLGEADVEAVDAAAIREVDGPEKLAVGMDFDRALPASGSEELFDQAQGLEDLQGAGMNDGRSIPVERRRLSIDQVAGHASAAQVGGEEQAGWAGSDDEHCGLMGWPVHRGQGFQKIWVWLGVVNPVTFSAKEVLRYAREGFSRRRWHRWKCRFGRVQDSRSNAVKANRWARCFAWPAHLPAGICITRSLLMRFAIFSNRHRAVRRRLRTCLT
jgi:hypothetical protein